MRTGHVIRQLPRLGGLGQRNFMGVVRLLEYAID